MYLEQYEYYELNLNIFADFVNGKSTKLFLYTNIYNSDLKLQIMPP